jgi:hypothetical protein
LAYHALACLLRIARLVAFPVQERKEANRRRHPMLVQKIHKNWPTDNGLIGPLKPPASEGKSDPAFED